MEKRAPQSSNYKRHIPLFGMLALLCMLALSSQPAIGQQVFGSVVGNVTDASGAAVPDAAIKVTMTQTNDVRTVQTDSSGIYNIMSVTPGTYTVEITKEGFRSFVAPNIQVNQNVVVRVDAQLQVGATTERIEVTATAAALQTDRADVHAELATSHLLDLPQPNRTYLGMMELIPGTTPPGGQLSGGTNNPSKGMTFDFNGTGTSAATVRIEGVNALNPWNRSAQSYVPSIEAIQNVNVATNANDAEQGMAGGAAVNVMLKSGSNDMHGSVFAYNSNSKFEANNYFANQNFYTVGGKKIPYTVPPLNNNNFGGSMGGYIIKNKLFYFGSWETDLAHSADSALLSIPGQKELSGDFSDSGNPIYDPMTGDTASCEPGTATANNCGKGRTPFAGSQIPKSRFDPVVLRMIPNIPKADPTLGNINNYYMNRKTIYNLHKIDTKFDYNATSKLRLSGRWGKQPYYNFQQPIYGEELGGSGAFPQSGAGNYLQHGHGATVSGSVNYVASPTMVVDATWGYVTSHQQLFPNKFEEKYGLDVLKIPGTNQGPLPWAGGVPNFEIQGGFATMGMSYPALEYMQPLYEYVGNVSKIKGSHTMRFGFDAFYQFPDHIEIRENRFIFTGASTILNGGAGVTPFNTVADYVLGRFNSSYQWIQVLQPYLKLRTWQYAAYARDQWQVNRKLTVNYGVRWEKYPVPHRDETGIYFADYFNTFSIQVCGEGGTPRDCGIKTSNKIFAPSIGIAYRPWEKFVIRAGYSLSPNQENMGIGQMQAFPGEVRMDLNPVNPSFGYGGTLSNGFPIIPVPVGTNGVYKIPANTGNLSSINSNKNYSRGYFQSYNFTIQRELPGGLLAQVGYVGMHAAKLQRGLNVNYAQWIDGGNPSKALYKFGHTSSANTLFFDGTTKYNSLQSTITKRLSHGLNMSLAYTWSKTISMSSSRLIPEYRYQNYYLSGSDRPHHIILSGTYQLPFGKGQKFVQQPILAAIVGGWSMTGIYNFWSGSPFTVTSSGASCNCDGSSQTADLVKADVSQGNIRGATDRNSTNLKDAYFDVMAYRAVTAKRFGTGGFNQLRGPGSSNLDMSIIRTINITERFKTQIRAEALNVSNTAHFANPGASSSPGNNATNMVLDANQNLVRLGGFGQITSTAPLGRIIDQRYFRFSLRLLW